MNLAAWTEWWVGLSGWCPCPCSPEQPLWLQGAEAAAAGGSSVSPSAFLGIWGEFTEIY